MGKKLFYIIVIALALSMAWQGLSSGASGSYFLVHLKGDIDDGTVLFIKRALEEADSQDLDAVVFEIDTYGGLVDASNKIRDEILASGVRTIAFVNQKAWSAGALIALSCNELYMATGSSIGAAETRPAEEKYISAYREQFKSTAQARGRDPELAGAMVDSDIVIDGVTEEGKILTLSADDAARLGFADGAFAGIDEMIEAAGLKDVARLDFSMNNKERMGQFLTSPVTSEILLVVGVLGLVIEAFTPGFGIFGTMGVLGFALFFYGRIITGMAGWEIVVLFVIGLALLIIELFIPGFGVLGVAGLIGIFSSFILSYPTPAEALVAVSIALVFAIAAIVILVRTLEKRGIKGNSFLGRLILTEITGKNVITRAEGEARKVAPLATGETGVVFTTLRPVGTAYFGEAKIEVLSEGEFLAPGTKVAVERIEGLKVIVRKADTSVLGSAGEAKADE